MPQTSTNFNPHFPTLLPQPGERTRADSEHLMTALGLDPDLYKVPSRMEDDVTFYSENKLLILQGDSGREERLPDNHLGRVHFNLRLSQALKLEALNQFLKVEFSQKPFDP